MPHQSKVLSVIAPTGEEYIANDIHQLNEHLRRYSVTYMSPSLFKIIIEAFSHVHWEGHAITVILTPENSSLNADKPIRENYFEKAQRKAFVNVGTIGHVDRGKTTLAAALTRLHKPHITIVNGAQSRLRQYISYPSQQSKALILAMNYNYSDLEKRCLAAFTHEASLFEQPRVDCPCP